MAGIIWIDNDNNVWVKGYHWTDGSGLINDAELILSIGRSLSRKVITGLTNASPIVVTCAGHGLSAATEIVIVDVAGNKAANGPQTVLDPTTDTFKLTGTTGSGALILPSDADRYPTLYQTLPGLQDAAFTQVKDGFYKSVVPASTDFLSGESYWVVATDLSRGYQVQTEVTAKPRILGNFLR